MRNLKKSIALVFLLVLAQLIFGTLAFAQSGRGAIAGSVKDEANSPLSSKSIQLNKEPLQMTRGNTGLPNSLPATIPSHFPTWDFRQAR